MLSKFHNDCVKIVDFLVKAYFWACDKFASPYCSVQFTHEVGQFQKEKEQLLIIETTFSKYKPV